MLERNLIFKQYLTKIVAIRNESMSEDNITFLKLLKKHKEDNYIFIAWSILLMAFIIKFIDLLGGTIIYTSELLISMITLSTTKAQHLAKEFIDLFGAS